MDLHDTVTSWFTRPETCFLLGAGCSACMNKPLIGKLTELVVKDLKQEDQDLFQSLKEFDGNKPNIEDFISHILRLQEISSRSNISFAHPKKLQETLSDIKRGIVKNIKDDWSASKIHKKFLVRLTNKKRTRDIFSLNYDTLIEASLECARIPYSDGFTGAQNAFFTPTEFTRSVDDGVLFRLFKLHGSINWRRDDGGYVRRIGNADIDSVANRLMIYPSEQKYIETQFGVYESMFSSFRSRLRQKVSNNLLITLGYSFNDEHINEAIIDSTLESPGSLHVIAFVGATDNLALQQSKLEGIAARSPTAINFYVGNKLYIGDALSRDDSENLLNLELWRFENVAAFLAGA